AEQAVVMAEQAVEIATKVRSERLNSRVRKTTEAAAGRVKGVDAVSRLKERRVQDIPECASSV
ncbi:hypothetical protein VM98_34450, partial [Streptomyces rubellomurinus subsp. indigoferus]